MLYRRTAFLAALAAVGLGLTAFMSPVTSSATVDVFNESSSSIYYLYASPCESNNWGDDLLGDQIIEPGDAGEITVSGGCWDFAAETDSGQELFVYGMELADGDFERMTFYDE